MAKLGFQFRGDKIYIHIYANALIYIYIYIHRGWDQITLDVTRLR